MTPFLLLWSALCGVTILSFWTYLANPNSDDPKSESIFWRFGRFYDAFFFNHGEPTAKIEAPAE